MNTNLPPGLQIPGLDQLPPSLQGWIVIGAVAVVILGRAWHAWTNGGGAKGIWSAVVFGTNTPKPPPAP